MTVCDRGRVQRGGWAGTEQHFKQQGMRQPAPPLQAPHRGGIGRRENGKGVAIVCDGQRQGAEGWSLCPTQGVLGFACMSYPAPCAELLPQPTRHHFFVPLRHNSFAPLRRPTGCTMAYLPISLTPYNISISTYSNGAGFIGLEGEGPSRSPTASPSLPPLSSSPSSPSSSSSMSPSSSSM